MKSRYLMSTSSLVWIKMAQSNNSAFALKISEPVRFSLLIRKILYLLGMPYPQSKLSWSVMSFIVKKSTCFAIWKVNCHIGKLYSMFQ